jgi:hypothetical protein
LPVPKHDSNRSKRLGVHQLLDFINDHALETSICGIVGNTETVRTLRQGRGKGPFRSKRRRSASPGRNKAKALTAKQAKHTKTTAEPGFSKAGDEPLGSAYGTEWLGAARSSLFASFAYFAVPPSEPTPFSQPKLVRHAGLVLNAES